MTPLVRAVAGVAVVLAAFATGLGAADADPRWLVQRPRLLVRSLFAILVVVPVVVVLFFRTVALPTVVEGGLTIAVVSIGIGPPAAFGRTRGRAALTSYEVALNVALLANAVVYVPAVVALHGTIFGHDLRLAPASVAVLALSRALAPLFVGMVVGRVAPQIVAPVARWSGVFVQLVVLTVVAAAIVWSWGALVALGGRAWLVCVTVVAAEIAIGHALGGPEPGTRRVLAAFSAMRFPALALLLASAAPAGSRFVPVILAYVITSAVLVALHGALSARRERRAGSPPRAPIFRAPAAAK